MGSFSIWHWLIVLVIVVLVFGTKKLKNIGSDVGGAVKNFKDAMADGSGGQDSEELNAIENEPTQQLIENAPKKAAPKRKAASTSKTTK